MRNYLLTGLMLISMVLLAFSEDTDSIPLPNMAESLGMGQISDPNSIQAFSTSVQGGFTTSQDSRSFGYDSFAVTAKWNLNETDQNLGLSAIVGTANWFVPSLNSIYPAEYLSSSEQGETATSINSLVAGLSYQFGNRKPQEKYWAAVDSDLKNINLKIFNTDSEIEKNQYLQEKQNLLWSRVVRPSLKSSVFQIGALFRVNSVELESYATAIDLNFTGAGSIGEIVDIVSSFHYIRNFDSAMSPNDGYFATVGFFWDLNSNPPVNTIGVLLGCSELNYNTRSGYSDTSLRITPYTWRYDATLVLSGLVRTQDRKGPGVGIRYSYLHNSAAKDFGQLSVLLSIDALSSP